MPPWTGSGLPEDLWILDMNDLFLRNWLGTLHGYDTPNQTSERRLNTITWKVISIYSVDWHHYFMIHMSTQLKSNISPGLKHQTTTFSLYLFYILLKESKLEALIKPHLFMLPQLLDVLLCLVDRLHQTEDLRRAAQELLCAPILQHTKNPSYSCHLKYYKRINYWISQNGSWVTWGILFWKSGLLRMRLEALSRPE